MAKEMKKMLRKPSQGEGGLLLTDSIEPKPTISLDLVSDARLFSQDFDLWFGKSVFGSTMAEVVQKDHSGHSAVSLLDTLNLVMQAYALDITKACEENTYAGFCRYICGTREKLTDDDWGNFLKTLSSHTATSYRRLRNEEVSELPAISVVQSPGNSGASALTTNESEEEFSSSSRSSLVSQNRQSSASNPATADETLQTQPPVQPPGSSVPAPHASPPAHRYTSVLKEHADVYGSAVMYERKAISLDPVSWHCAATFGNFAGEGTGSSFQKAKHAASKQLCDAMGLLVQ